MPRDYDDYSAEPLTEEERKALRRIIEGDKNWRWLGALARRVGLWVGGVIASIMIFRDAARDFWAGLQRFFGG